MKITIKRWQRILVLGLAALISCGLFLALSSAVDGWGFPLDDAWIHHTFARNFAESGRWSFQDSELSGGSTGPLWGLALSAFYLLDFDPIWSTYVLGFLLLWAAAVAGSLLAEALYSGKPWFSLAAGILIAMEWHLVWAALSGMETMLLIVVSLFFFTWVYQQGTDWWLPGLLIGLTVWIRPDGVTLLGPALLMLLFQNRGLKLTIRQALILLGSFIITAGPYFWFNWVVAGDFWPNTFYAKQAEYASLREAFFLSRYINLSVQFVTGIGVILLPGLLVELYCLVKDKRWGHLAGFLWFLGYIGLYAWKLPVDYQHGRYIMPAMPVGFLLGLAGLFRSREMEVKNMMGRIIYRAWGYSAVFVGLVFLVLGGRSYGMDVAVINSEMVAAAEWIKGNTLPESVVAAHDIGALGYFSGRKVVDLAGLVTPDVIPYIREEDKIRDYLNQKDVDYLVTFPSWYPVLTSGLESVYQTGSIYSRRFGMDNMEVFKWD